MSKDKRPYCARVSVVSLPQFHEEEAEIFLSIYGPRGGTRLGVPISLTAARELRGKLEGALRQLEEGLLI